MTCPLCGDPGHRLSKCPRWIGNPTGTCTTGVPMPSWREVDYAKTEAQIAALAVLQAESDRVLHSITDGCPHCHWVQDSVAVCDKHAPLFRKHINGT